MKGFFNRLTLFSSFFLCFTSLFFLVFFLIWPDMSLMSVAGHRRLSPVLSECRFAPTRLLLLASRSVLLWSDGRPGSGPPFCSYYDATESPVDDGGRFESFRSQSLFDSYSSLHSVSIWIRCSRFQSRTFASPFRPFGRVARVVLLSQTLL